MKRSIVLTLTACLALSSSLAAQASDPRQDWLQATVQASNPVREQLAMLSQPGQPLAIRVYHGPDLRALTGQPLLAYIDDRQLALSEGLLEQLRLLEHSPQPAAARWTLLYVLAYLGARHPDLQSGNGPQPQQKALAMLSALNQVLATAWEEAGRPQQPQQRQQLLGQVMAQVPYARLLQPALSANGQPGLRMDADGFVLDQANARLLASSLGNRTGHAGLERLAVQAAR